jgi:hypothetical protein
MQEKTLLEVDARIAKLRDNIAAGRGNVSESQEIDRLIEQRRAFIQDMATGLEGRRPPAQNIVARG